MALIHTLNLFVLWFFDVILSGDPLQGFCNGILFVVFVGEVRQQLFESMRGCVGFRCLNCCGMLCCCYYCCSCFCKGCNECFECCLEGDDGSHKMGDLRNDHYGTYHHGHDRNEAGAMHQNDSYYASQYRFLATKSEETTPTLKGAAISIHHHPTNSNPTVHRH